MYENNIAFFLYQTNCLLYNENITSCDISYIISINTFITLYHNEYKEYFEYLYLPDSIQELIDDDFYPLPGDYINKIFEKYHSYEDYIKLTDNIDSETKSKITYLSYKFVKYIEEAILLYNEESTTYTRVLQ